VEGQVEVNGVGIDTIWQKSDGLIKEKGRDTMKRTYTVGFLVAAFMIAVVFTPSWAAEKVAPITIKCSHAFSPKMNIMQLWMEWAEEVTKRSDGRIEFTWFHGGAISKPGEEQEHCRRGVVQMVGTSATWYSYMPLWEMNGALPFQPKDTLLAVKTKWQLYQEFPELRNEVEKMNMKLMFIGPYGDYHIISRIPLNSLDDFQGLKVAILGRQQPKWFEGTGATTIFLPGPARYEALEKGAVDASLMGGLGSTMAFRHPEMCKYMLLCGLGQYCSFFYTMNQDTWNKISPKDQKMMEELSKTLMFEWAPKRIDGDEVKFRKIMEEKFGVNFHTLSYKDRTKWAQSLPNLAKAWVDEAENDSDRELRKRMWLRNLELVKKGGYEWPMDWSNVD
jgi:TRAP-type C4-dicarboxylate transport system substrate-binding protein